MPLTDGCVADNVMDTHVTSNQGSSLRLKGAEDVMRRDG